MNKTELIEELKEIPEKAQIILSTDGHNSAFAFTVTLGWHCDALDFIYENEELNRFGPPLERKNDFIRLDKHKNVCTLVALISGS